MPTKKVERGNSPPANSHICYAEEAVLKTVASTDGTLIAYDQAGAGPPLCLFMV